MKPLFEGSEWTPELIEKTWKVIDKVAKEEFNLDYYPEQIELITSEQMLDCYSSVAMPLLYNHWSFGKSFIQNEKNYKTGRQGLAYEVVINTNPCIAYLVENNTMTMQTLVMAHALCGHGSFFKHNYLFKNWTNASSILDYLNYAKNYIKKCEEQYGEDKVEALLDACHALQYNSVDKYKRSSNLSAELQHKREKEWMEYSEKTFNDLWRTVPKSKEKQKKYESSIFPEENILRFLEKHSPVLETWQREICRIVRKISQYFYPQMQSSLMNEGWACVKGDTEYLSPTGWKRIDEYDGGEVAQYNKDGKIEYVMPTNYIVEYNKELIHFEGESFDQCVTPDHRMPYITQRGNLNIKEAQECPEYGSFIKAGELQNNTKIALSDTELRLMVAISADGHFSPRTSTNYVQMGFSKERKVNRLETLLKEANIEYKKTRGTQGRTWINFHAPERNKQLSEYYSASQSQLRVIVDEVFKWDGTEKSGRSIYFSSDKQNADFIQWAISMTENSASLRQEGNLYIVEKLQRNTTCIESTTRKKMEGLHTVYCFTVDSGMFMTRRNNKVSVTGNCFVHHNIMTHMHDKGYLTDGAYLEFLHSHSGVVRQPEWTEKSYSGINIYALGFAMMNDIRRICENPTEEDKYWFPDICNTHWKKTLEYVMMNYRDESFVLQFLSPKVIRDFKLFVLDSNEENPYLEVGATHDDEDVLKIRKALAEHYDVNKRVPKVEISGASMKTDRWLYLEYSSENGKVLEYKDMKKTVMYIRQLWGFPVKMAYVDEKGDEVDYV